MGEDHLDCKKDLEERMRFKFSQKAVFIECLPYRETNISPPKGLLESMLFRLKPVWWDMFPRSRWRVYIRNFQHIQMFNASTVKFISMQRLTCRQRTAWFHWRNVGETWFLYGDLVELRWFPYKREWSSSRIGVYMAQYKDFLWKVGWSSPQYREFWHTEWRQLPTLQWFQCSWRMIWMFPKIVVPSNHPF